MADGRLFNKGERDKATEFISGGAPAELIEAIKLSLSSKNEEEVLGLANRIFVRHRITSVMDWLMEILDQHGEKVSSIEVATDPIILSILASNTDYERCMDLIYRKDKGELDSPLYLRLDDVKDDKLWEQIIDKRLNGYYSPSKRSVMMKVLPAIDFVNFDRLVDMVMRTV